MGSAPLLARLALLLCRLPHLVSSPHGLGGPHIPAPGSSVRWEAGGAGCLPDGCAECSGQAWPGPRRLRVTEMDALTSWLAPEGEAHPPQPCPTREFLEGHLGVGGRLRRLHGAGPPFLRASGCPPTRHRPSCGKQTRYFHAFIGYICFSLITYLCILLIIHFIVFSIIHVTYNFCYIIILFITISYIIILNNYGYII